MIAEASPSRRDGEGGSTRALLAALGESRMKSSIETRFEELLDKGAELAESLPRDEYGLEEWINSEDISRYQSWLASSANLICSVARKGSHFHEECERLCSNTTLANGIPTHVVQKMHGLLVSGQQEWESGLLREIEYIVFAESFDDFLDHAAQYHKGNKKVESAVLASAVLEDTVKWIAAKNSISPSGLSLEPLIDTLVKSGVFTPVKAKRVKAYAGVRNHALHAEWDEFDIQDVGEMIKGIRELISDFL
jgi:uncharacterized protein YutE (UPF0331/DUF86 family)